VTGAPVLALFSAPRVDADAAEWLRVLAAFVASGRSVRLGEIGSGRSVLSRDDLPSEALRCLDQVAPFGVVPTALDATGLREALRGCGVVLRYGDPARAKSPVTAEMTDERLESLSDEDLLRILLEADQVIRTVSDRARRGRVSG
jgi:hypothetical protein